jgi:DNA polymerase V
MNSTIIPKINKDELGPSYLPEELKNRTFELPENSILIPKFRCKIQCGLFGISDDFIEKYQSLDSHFIQNKESTFFFDSIGRSMEPTIFPGEILIVDRSINSHHTKVCVVAYHDELICKRVYIKKDHIILHSDNPRFKPIKVYDSHSVLVWGVVTARAGEVN